MAIKKAVKLGQTVTYVSTKGLQKLALVIGTPESIAQGHFNVPQLDTDRLHLLVISPTGNQYTRYSVPTEALAKQEDAEAIGGFYTV